MKKVRANDDGQVVADFIETDEDLRDRQFKDINDRLYKLLEKLLKHKNFIIAKSIFLFLASLSWLSENNSGAGKISTNIDTENLGSKAKYKVESQNDVITYQTEFK